MYFLIKYDLPVGICFLIDKATLPFLLSPVTSLCSSDVQHVRCHVDIFPAVCKTIFKKCKVLGSVVYKVVKVKL